MTVSEHAFAALIKLFPSDFREQFGQDMCELFGDQLRATRSAAGRLGVLRLWLRTIPSLMHAAALEHRHQPYPVPSRHDSVIETFLSDLRFAMRKLSTSPVFAIVAIVVIALGSGAVTTIFSAMNAVVLRPLPGTTRGGHLVLFERRSPDFKEGVSGTYAFYRHMRDHNRSLDGAAAWTKADMSISNGGEATAVHGNLVSGNFFAVLGVRPSLGRFFTADEDRTPLTHPVIVVSHSFWEMRLGSDSSVVGRVVKVNGNPYTLIGVAPPGFRGAFTPLKVEAWVPLMMQPHLRPDRNLNDDPWLWMFGRLRDGVTRSAAQRDLAAMTAQWVKDNNEQGALRNYNSIRLSDLTGLPDDARSAFIGFTALLLGAAGLVLLIASVNVASMLSARAIARRREMAVRAALGAGRAQLVRQLLTESLLLFFFGAFGGMAIASITTTALEQIPIPGDASLSLELSPDPRVLAFALLISLITGVVFGLAPAFQGVGKDITSRLRNDSAGSGSRRSFAGNALIVGQLALSLVLLVAAGLFIRALNEGSRIDPGFETSGVTTAVFNSESWGYDSTKAQGFYRTLSERVSALPGVSSVAYTNVMPLAFATAGATIEPNGPGTADAAGRVRVEMATVDGRYFDVVRIPLVRGRVYTDDDDARAPHVAIVNETFVKRLWPDGNALGRTFGLHGDRVMVVGVARDAKYGSLTEKTPPYVYIPTGQMWQPNQTLLVRATVDPTALAPAIRDAVRDIDGAVPRPLVRTLREETSIVLFPQRIAAIVTGVLGAVGLLLAAVGLYGIIAYSVGRRTREIGLRVALGAQRWDVLRMIIREGMWLAGVGVAVGIALAAAATRLIAGFLFDVSPIDAVTFVGMSALFVAVAFLASYLPARRAASTDPLTALRSE
jgi:predicted permease